jgi:ATP-dependent protease HslVU (ClpYQ) peptidase subunit
MTAIIGIKQNKKIILLSDGAMSVGNYKQTDDSCKIYELTHSAGCYISGTGLRLGFDYIRDQKDVFPKNSDTLTYSMMVTKVVPAMFASFRKANFLKPGKKGETLPVALIVMTKKRLFSVMDNGAVVEINEGFVCLGSGSQTSFTALKLLEGRYDNVTDWGIAAIQEAIKYTPTVDYPIYYQFNDDPQLYWITDPNKKTKS